MNQLSEILDEKGAEVLQIEADASVFPRASRAPGRRRRRSAAEESNQLVALAFA